MPITVSGVQYSGIWTMQQVDAALAAGTWPSAPAPHLYAWGSGTSGNLGLGNNTNYSSPKQVGSLTNWSVVAGGQYGTVAVRTDGTLWAWGDNSYGQLGLGNTTSYSSPKQVGALTNWSVVVSDYSSIRALKTDGTLWAWGYNASGQLGLGNTTSYSSPKQVGVLSNWLYIAANYAFTLAIKTDGTLWSWGVGAYGNLGLNNRTYYSSPKQVGSLTTWASVGAGISAGSSYGIKTDGTLWSWGVNAQGGLGLGNTTSYSSPKQVGSLTNWSSIKGTNQGAMAVKTNGTLWSWGQNAYGMGGLGNITYYSSPKQVGSLTNWLSIASGGYSYAFMALKTDGTLWGMGRNAAGQLGLGDRTDRSSPTQVGSLTTWTKAFTANNYSFGIALT